ncbi:MAG: hypothetical protein P3W87_001125 [Gammaproteobacteria bacterium]|nr:hypothetical protein [Gammaproteobacteria bacterium]
MDAGNFIKTREIRLRGPHPGLTAKAALMLGEIPGVLMAESPYSTAMTCVPSAWCGILQILESWGLHLDASLWSKLRYALAFYSEDAQRETLRLSISPPEAYASQPPISMPAMTKDRPTTATPGTATFEP